MSPVQTPFVLAALMPVSSRSTGALLLRVAYGYDVLPDQQHDPLVTIVEEAMRGFSLVSKPGEFLVDTIPILKYIPSWFPGAQFQKLGKHL